MINIYSYLYILSLLLWHLPVYCAAAALWVLPMLPSNAAAVPLVPTEESLQHV